MLSSRISAKVKRTNTGEKLKSKQFGSKTIKAPVYVSFDDQIHYETRLPEEVDIQMGEVITTQAKHLSISTVLVTKNDNAIGMVVPRATCQLRVSNGASVVSYKYEGEESWRSITSSSLSGEAKKVGPKKVLTRKTQSSSEVSLSLPYNPIFVSFEKPQSVTKEFPKKAKLIAGEIQTRDSHGTTQHAARLVELNDEVIGVILNRTTFQTRVNSNIQMKRYRRGGEGSIWHNLPETGVSLDSIEELIKIDKETKQTIKNVFVEDISKEHKSIIPHDARLVGGAKHYSLDGMDFEQETLFVVHSKSKYPKVIGEVVPEHIIKEPDYRPNYSIKEKHRSYYSFDPTTQTKHPLLLSDVFPESRQKKQKSTQKSLNKERTSTLGVFAKSKIKPKPKSKPKKQGMFSHSKRKASESEPAYQPMLEPVKWLKI